MSLRYSFPVRLLLLPILIVVLVGAFAVVAAPVTQDGEVIATTEERLLSVRLPADWSFASMGASAIYSASLIVGEDAETVRGAQNWWLAGVAAPGVWGAFNVVNPQTWMMLSPDPMNAIDQLISISLEAQFPAPQVHNDGIITLQGGYQARILDVTLPGINARAYVGAFEHRGNVVLFILAVSPAQLFDENRVLLETIGESVRVPAEAGAVTQPLPTPFAPTSTPIPTVEIVPTSTPIPVDVPTTVPEPLSLTGPLAATPGGELSFRLPEGWVFQPEARQGLATAILFAQTEGALLDARRAATGDGTIEGISGVIGISSPMPGLTPQAQVEQFKQEVSAFVISRGLPAAPPFEPLATSAGYTGEIMLAQERIFAFLIVGSDVVMIALNKPLFSEETIPWQPIIDSIRLPAEGGAIVPTEVAPIQTEVAGPTLDPMAPVLLRMQDDRLSLEIPASWFFWDRTADGDIVAYGDSELAVNSRLQAVRPDLISGDFPLTGNGGVIALYPMSNFGIDPANPDVGPLMDRLLAQLEGQGYQILAEPFPLVLDGNNGLYALIRGAEYGFLALVPFGDEIAYITGTGMPDTFEDNRATLYTIVESVRVPAAVPPTPTPTATPLPGLSGLGGLTSATEEAAATEEPSGLSGLGGLTTATEEAAATSEASPRDEGPQTTETAQP